MTPQASVIASDLLVWPQRYGPSVKWVWGRVRSPPTLERGPENLGFIRSEIACNFSSDL